MCIQEGLCEGGDRCGGLDKALSIEQVSKAHTSAANSGGLDRTVLELISQTEHVLSSHAKVLTVRSHTRILNPSASRYQ